LKANTNVRSVLPIDMLAPLKVTISSMSTSQTTVDGLPAELVNVTYTYGVPLQGTMLITLKGKNGYCLVGAAPPAEWATNSGELSGVLNSLKAN